MIHRHITLVVLLLNSLLTSAGLAQSISPLNTPENSVSSPVNDEEQSKVDKSYFDLANRRVANYFEFLWMIFSLSVSILVFGFGVIVLTVWVMIRRNRYWDAVSIQLVSLTVIVTAGVFVIIAGYSDRQLAPIMGLLGSLAGYILGNRDKRPIHRKKRLRPSSGASTSES